MTNPDPQKSPCCGAPLGPSIYVQPDVVVQLCSQCGIRHFGLIVDPLVLNMRGAAL